MNTRAFITGVSGPELNAAEREFIRSERPWGFILFKRNIETPAQVSLLVRELRESINDPEAPILVDQEGGRVQRFGPPHWPVYPPGAVFGVLYDIDPALGLSAARLRAGLMGGGGGAAGGWGGGGGGGWRPGGCAPCGPRAPMPSSATVPMESSRAR